MAFNDFHLFFDDVQAGQEWESPGRTITEADIVNFAGLSGDFNPMHMDAEFASHTPFRKRIAHGMLVLAVGSGLGIYAPPMRTIAFVSMRNVTFKEPVFAGDTIKVRCKVLAIEPRSRGRRATITWERTVLNQEGKVVLEVTSETLVEGRALRTPVEAQPSEEQSPPAGGG